MKWSWKSFGLQFASAFMLGCIFGFSIRIWMDGRGAEGYFDPTVFAMGLGGLLGPVVPAVISGWKGWALKPLLVASVMVSALYAHNPGAGIGGLVAAAICYWAASKIRSGAFYYAPSETVKSGASAAQPGRRQPAQAEHERI